MSFRDLNAALASVKALDIPIEHKTAIDPTFGVRSFFLRAPNVELVEATSLLEAAWEFAAPTSPQACS